MIKLTITLYTSKNHVTVRTEEYENVSVIDLDETYMRIIHRDGTMHRIELSEVIGYTAEVI